MARGDTLRMDRERMNVAAKVMVALAIIGALNWGLIGFFNWNLVDAIFGGGSQETTSGASRFIYALVGLAGLAALFLVPWGSRSTLHEGPRVRTGGPAEVRP